MKTSSYLRLLCLALGFMVGCDLSASFFVNMAKKHPVITAGVVALPTLILAYKKWSDYKEFQNLCQDTGDIFMVGEKSFCDICPPEGLTRKQWYMQKLSEQENYLRKKIISILKITPEEYAHYEQLAKEDILQQEAAFESKDLRGQWLIDIQQQKEVRYSGPATDFTFTIEDKDLDLAITILRDYGYTGKIVCAESSGEGAAAIAYYNTIKIFPVLLGSYGGGTENMLLALRHELSHIKHGDLLFEKTIQKYVELNFIKQDNGQFFVNQNALDVKGLTFDHLEKARKLLQQTWFDFHERRADVEAFLAIKDHAIFKRAIAGKDQYYGFPFRYEMIQGYQQWARVPFLQDFCKGIENDSKRVR